MKNEKVRQYNVSHRMTIVKCKSGAVGRDKMSEASPVYLFNFSVFHF
jgi:hypothetical protein